MRATGLVLAAALLGVAAATQYIREGALCSFYSVSIQSYAGVHASLDIEIAKSFVACHGLRLLQAGCEAAVLTSRVINRMSRLWYLESNR